MEQAPYWIWTNPKPNNSKVEAARGTSLKTPMTYNKDRWPSWEEQAFAEDATGAFGGCIWPPRSYSCSFCGREFRSAQALGGHMNVHRRDRARLKQTSPSTSPDHLIQSQLVNHIHPQNHFIGFDEYHPHPPPVCALVYHHPNPNHQNHDPFSVLASSSSSPWPSTPYSNCDHHDQEVNTTNNMRSPISSSRPPIWANFVVNKTSDPKPCNKAKVIRTDLSVSLNLVLHPTSYHHEDDEAMRSCKKRRRDSPDSSSNQAQEHTTLEDLDLELRLGGRPEVIK